MNKDDSFELDNLSPFSWKEHAYERLKVLYGVSKILSSFDNIDSALPKVLSMCSATFPFLTAIMIENRGDNLKTRVWNADNADKEHVDLAIVNAKESFIYLTGASVSKSNDIRTAKIHAEILPDVNTVEKVFTRKDNFSVIPLVVDRLPAFGILQLEGSLGLTESDLEFVGALGDLISISIDRHHKTQFEFELRQREAVENSVKLSRSTAHVLNLEAERELRERFVSLLTHDLRTPLSAINMNSQQIERNYMNSQAVRSYATRIKASVKRADQMISDLLDANLITSGERLPINIEFFELTALVQDTLDELSAIHGSRFILKTNDLIEVYWDFRGIRRIVENLCNNAIKYGAPDTQIIINLFEEAGKATIEVCNKGEVISDQDQKFLFQQFVRGRKKAAVKGWGIGLTLVRGVTEAHGGKVKVRSEADTGTIFTITIPMDARPFIIQ